MTVFAAALSITLSISCSSSAITMAEAKVLAIHAARASGVSDRYDLAAEEDEQSPIAYIFRVFATNPDPGTASSLAGWFAVNKKTAALTDPFLDDRPIPLPALRDEQIRLRAIHCQQ